MGVSKVDFAGDTLIDLTGDTVNEQVLLSGYTAHGADGEPVEGKAVIPTKVSQLENDAGYAKTESPEFTGIPTAPTPPDNTNSTQIATTAYVKKLIANLVNGAPETLDTLKEIADALGENDDAVQALNVAIGNKVDKVSGKGLSTNDFTTAEKNKLAGIANNANNYSLPLASATVRGGAKIGYTENGKNYPVELSNEQMYVNVPWTDNNTWKANTAASEGYVTAGSGHANQVWKTDANGVPGWRADANTTYSAATQSANGLMTAADKKKLDGIAEGANKTTLTTSLAVTQSGVSALDGTVGKVLNDKIENLKNNSNSIGFFDASNVILPLQTVPAGQKIEYVPSQNCYITAQLSGTGTQTGGSIYIDGVDTYFCYSTASTQTLIEVTFPVKSGQKIGIYSNSSFPTRYAVYGMM